MAKHQSVTRQLQHQEREDYGGIDAGASRLASNSYTIAECSVPLQQWSRVHW